MEQVQKVPFLDLKSQIGPIRSELDEAISEAIDASDFILGPRVEAFETAFADYCGVKHSLGVGSGTEALFLIFKALGIGAGDEIITVSNVFIAGVEVIARLGAKPVIVDVDSDTFNIDPNLVEAAITDRTKAIMPIHLFGLPADMDALMDIAERHNLFVVEDACQAHGAMYKGRRAGSIGHAAAFSFYPTKNLGGMGDGGAVTTNDTALAGKVRSLRHHAQAVRNCHEEVGYNSRLDSIQAVILETKLKYLDDWNTKRREVATRLRTGLEGTDYVFQTTPEGSESVYNVLAVHHPRRESVLDQLERRQVGYGRHIAMPVYQQPGYSYLGYERGDFPVTEKLCDELVSLPIAHNLTSEQIDYVVDALAKVVVSV